MVAKKKTEEEIMLISREEELEETALTKSQRSRNIAVLSVNNFFAGSANVIYFILYAPYFSEIANISNLPNPERLFGIVGTIASVISLLGLIASDFLNGLVGFKRVFIIAQVLIVTSFSFFIFTPEKIIWIIIAVLLLNFSFTLSESPGNIILTETAGEKKKGKISSIVALFGRFGDVLVSTILVIVTSIINSNFEDNLTNKERSYFFSYSTGVYIIIAILVIFFITDPLKLRKKDSKEVVVKEPEVIQLQDKNDDLNNKTEMQDLRVKRKGSQFIQGFIDTFKDKWVLRVALTFFFDATLWSIGLGVYWAAMLDPDLLGQYALVDFDISILSLISSIIVLLAMFPTGWLVDKIGAKTLLFASEICGFLWTIFIVIFVFFPQLYWLLILSRIAIGLSIALWIPSTIALFTNVESKRKSKVYNSIAIFRTIGWLPGGVIAGLLYDAIPQPFGFLTPIFILITGLFVLIPLFFTLANKPPNGNNSVKNNKEINV
ncbi:MAG: MFS transporter [Candidatus Thorarchaeota archaeon]